MGIKLDQVKQPDPALALDDGADRPVLEADELGDLGQRPDAVQLVHAVDLFGVAVALGDEGHRRVRAHGALEGLDAAVATDLEGHDHLGKDHGPTQRDEREDLDLVHAFLGRGRGFRGWLVGHGAHLLLVLATAWGSGSVAGSGSGSPWT